MFPKEGSFSCKKQRPWYRISLGSFFHVNLELKLKEQREIYLFGYGFQLWLPISRRYNKTTILFFPQALQQLASSPTAEALSWFSQLLLLISQSYHIQDEARRAMNMRLLPDRIPPFEPIAHDWCKLTLGWIKVNTDGAQNPHPGESFCGRVGRDDNMRWCFGFSKKTGICSAFDAELGEVYEGLG
ncbi:hypothetical protein V6N12_037666 [Hibiscus sabdariffa]|uniref:RNase H type-1 domain-containing protein n=1 Tax=Hibiscus sabdariffa TaxID=183260 RepID=A0ABR2C2U6_9ROSI